MNIDDSKRMQDLTKAAREDSLAMKRLTEAAAGDSAAMKQIAFVSSSVFVLKDVILRRPDHLIDILQWCFFLQALLRAYSA